MKKFLIALAVIIVVALIGAIIFFTLTPIGKSIINEWHYNLEKTDERTYENQKEVEDTCRAMISSYNQDKLVYEQYKDSDILEERSWANNAKIRANQTASTYNNYILKNSFVWKGNVPSDICNQLEYLT